MNTLHHSPSVPARRCGGFSLIEIMVAVGLMAVITLGLLAMFYQTQRAIHLGSTQTDVLESGRATMQLLVGELAQATATGDPQQISLRIEDITSLWQPRPGDIPQVNMLQELYFLRQENDQWFATGYFVDTPAGGGAGTLHRFVAATNFPPSGATPPDFARLYAMFTNANHLTAPRVADRIVNFRVRAYDRSGNPINPPAGLLLFTNDLLPAAYLDVELGILEPRTYAKYLALTNDTDPVPALRYLSNQIERVHLFRQRIPLRTVQ